MICRLPNLLFKPIQHPIFLFAPLLVIYLLLMPTNEALYDLLMFPFPDPRTPDLSKEIQPIRDNNIAVKSIYFHSANGRLLHGYFFELPNTKRVFLFSHGKGNNIFIQIPKARRLLSCGASVFMYDYQGFGMSQGKPSIEGACDDATAAYDYLVQREGRKSADIIAIGESFGSGVTGQLSLRRPLAGIIILSGFSSIMSAGKKTLFWLKLYPRALFPKQIMDNVPAFNGKHPPLLIVHGKTDRVIPISEALNLYNRASAPKRLLLFPEGHCTYVKSDVFGNTVRSFILSNRI